MNQLIEILTWEPYVKMQYELVLMLLLFLLQQFLLKIILFVFTAVNFFAFEWLFSALRAVIHRHRGRTSGHNAEPAARTGTGKSAGTSAAGMEAARTPSAKRSSGTGTVVDKGDIRGLRDAVKMICEKGKDAYRSACREHALKNFRKEDRYAEYMDLYESLL